MFRMDDHSFSTSSNKTPTPISITPKSTTPKSTTPKFESITLETTNPKSMTPYKYDNLMGLISRNEEQTMRVQNNKNKNKNTMMPNTQEQIWSPTTSFRNKTAKRKIGKFIKTHRSKITATYLTHVCSNKGECMTFGKEFFRIHKFFNQFVDFAYSSAPIKHMCAPSINGMVLEVPFMRDRFKSNALMKIVQIKSTRMPDNLYYEFMVGCFVNQFALKFPCFVHTYGAYVCSPEFIAQVTDLASETSAPPIIMKDHVTDISLIQNAFDNKNPVNNRAIDKSCQTPKQIALLTQFFSKSQTLSDYAKQDAHKLGHRFIPMLYQIYSALRCMASQFSHYDLHTGNVLVVQLPPNTYIEHHYHSASSSVPLTFKLDVLCKIIDYGRCYFDNKQTSWSSNEVALLVQSLCNVSTNKDWQGYPFPFGTNNNNQTVDLLLVYYLTKYIVPSKTPYLDELDYITQWLAKPSRKPMQSDYLSQKGMALNTVGDMAAYLRDRLRNSNNKMVNNWVFNNSRKLGELHIWENGTRDMKWIPT